jgi:hypothetical protein
MSFVLIWLNIKSTRAEQTSESVSELVGDQGHVVLPLPNFC